MPLGRLDEHQLTTSWIRLTLKQDDSAGDLRVLLTIWLKAHLVGQREKVVCREGWHPVLCLILFQKLGVCVCAGGRGGGGGETSLGVTQIYDLCLLERYSGFLTFKLHTKHQIHTYANTPTSTPPQTPHLHRYIQQSRIAIHTVSMKSPHFCKEAAKGNCTHNLRIDLFMTNINFCEYSITIMPRQS